MIGSDVIRGYCDTILLSLLAQGDSYGYELSRAIRERSGGAYVMKETTLYAKTASVFQLVYQRTHLYRFWSGAKHKHYPFHLELPLAFCPRRRPEMR